MSGNCHRKYPEIEICPENGICPRNGIYSENCNIPYIFPDTSFKIKRNI